MKILALLLVYMSLFSLDYDNLLIRAQASIFPKIILLDKNINSNVIDSTISLAVIYNKREFKEAQILKDFIDSKYRGVLGEYKFQVNLINVENFSDADSSTAYYLFDSSDSNKKRVISHALNHRRICFSYNYKDFDDNTLISLFLKEKTYIYINKSVINDYNIKFVPIFYNIAKAK